MVPEEAAMLGESPQLARDGRITGSMTAVTHR
jgi:hypothetical protein